MSGFVAAVEWRRLVEIVKQYKSFLLYPIHEKVYLYYEDVRNLLIHEYNGAAHLKQLESENISNVNKTRYILADNKIVKKFLRKNILQKSSIEAVREEVRKLLNKGMAHYVWYCEIPLEEGYFIFIANPTYSRITSKSIFYNEQPIYTTEQMALLSYE